MVVCPYVEVLIYLVVVIVMLCFRAYQKRGVFKKEYPELF